MRKIVAVSLCAILVLLTSTGWTSPIVQSYGTFDVTFYNSADSDGFATGQQDWTGEQMADVGAAIGEWCSRITDTPGRQVQLHVFWRELDSYGTSVLGGSASYRAFDGTTQWNLGEYVWREGIDAEITNYGFDTIIQYDITCAGASWNFGDGMPGASEVDFRSVATHEIGHSLGWSSTYDPAFDDWGWLGFGFEGLTEWDRNLVDSMGNKPVNGGEGSPENFNETDNPIYWDGENAVNYYGGLVPIYAPESYQPGSSLSHLDEGALGEYLMSPMISLGQEIRMVSELEWAMMEDLGWSVIPEPATILILGFGGLLLRRRK